MYLLEVLIHPARGPFHIRNAALALKARYHAKREDS
jgi:hypothetical protein